MLFRFSTLVVAAGLLASTGAVSAQEIPSDLPVSSLLTSAQSHLSRGETNEALTYYDAAVARDPTNYLTFFKRATTYLSLGRTSQATDDFNKVLALKPGFEGAHMQLAKIRSKTADWDGARAEYLAADKKADSPEIAELDEAKGAASLAGGAAMAKQWDECVAQAGVAIVIASRSPALRELRARCRFERGELEEGMGDLQHLVKLKPGDTTPHVTISATAFYGLGDLDTGLAQMRKCLHSDPDSKVCKKLFKQEKAIQKAYSRVEEHLNKGRTATGGRALIGSDEEPGLLHDVRQHVEELRQARSLPQHVNSKLHDKLVEMVCQAYSESNHRDANKYCDDALELNPDSFWGLFNRGKNQLKQEDFEAAIGSLRKATEVRGDLRDKVNPVLNKAEIALKRSKTKDYYKVLGVASDADERQIKSAYRKATKLHHPDKAIRQGVSKEEAEKRMASINEAYEVLSNPELRARFDRGDDPNSQDQGQQPFHGSPFQHGGHPFMFHQQGGGGGGGGGGQNFKFHFNGNPFGF